MSDDRPAVAASTPRHAPASAGPSPSPRPGSGNRGRASAALREVTNPATIKGAITLGASVAVLALPDLSTTLVELALGLGLLTSGAYDIWSAVRGARPRHQRASRLLTVARGLAAVVGGIVVLVAPRVTLAVLVLVAGLYLLARGAITIAAGVFGRDRERRTSRLTLGAGALAVGVLALTAPEALTSGLVSGSAVAGIIVGSIVLAYGLRLGVDAGTRVDLSGATVGEIVWDWVRGSDVGAERRESVAETLYFEPPARAAKLTAWWVMLAISVAIATFAVLQDSTAVVIGAMLVAPLMTPILGLAGALVNGWRARATSSAALVGAGAAGAIGIGYLIAGWVPQLVAFESNSQIISRVSPTFVDMLIAVAAGAAGAFATVNVRVASSIAGVAIAVALVPPLAVVGVALEAGQLQDALGSLLLFSTNFVSIVLAAALVFVLTGFAESSRLRSHRRQVIVTLAPFIALAMIILVPLVFTAEGVLAVATKEKTAQAVVQEWVGDESRLRIQQVSVSGSSVTVSLTGPERIPPPRSLQQAMSEALDEPVTVAVEFTPSSFVEVDPQGRIQRVDPDPAA